MELLELLVGAHDDGQTLFDGAELRAGNGKVGLSIVGAGVNAVPDAAGPEPTSSTASPSRIPANLTSCGAISRLHLPMKRSYASPAENIPCARALALPEKTLTAMRDEGQCAR